MLSIALLASILLLGDASKHPDPETNMTSTQIIEHWGYPSETHSVTTRDGYILELHRIPYGKPNVTWPNGKRPVVFMQHGLLTASHDWIINLPDQSAGFVAADAGFDVWLGNMRGNTYSAKHTTLDPSQTAYWKFSWDEMSANDLEAMIDKVLEVTGQQSVYYMGHSQGTLTMFTHLAKDKGAFAKKIKKFFALAPVGSVKNIKGFLSYFAHKFHKELDLWFDLFGAGKFLPNSWIMKMAANDICGGLKIEADMCDNFLFAIAGPESNQWNETRIPVYITHDPADTSSQNILHWTQMVLHGGVPAFDWGPVQNLKKYGSTAPPEYDFSKISGTQIYLYWSDDDWLADPQDINDFLLKNLNPAVIAQNNKLDHYNHLDFTWGLRATNDIYLPALDIAKNDYLGK